MGRLGRWQTRTNYNAMIHAVQRVFGVHEKEGLHVIVESVSNRTVAAHLTDMGVDQNVGDQ